jgi:hypothetical protein
MSNNNHYGGGGGGGGGGGRRHNNNNNSNHYGGGGRGGWNTPANDDNKRRRGTQGHQEYDDRRLWQPGQGGNPSMTPFSADQHPPPPAAARGNPENYWGDGGRAPPNPQGRDPYNSGGHGGGNRDGGMSAYGPQPGQSSVGKTDNRSQERPSMDRNDRGRDAVDQPMLSDAGAPENMDQDSKQPSSFQASLKPWEDMTLKEKVHDLVRNGHTTYQCQ